MSGIEPESGARRLMRRWWWAPVLVALAVIAALAFAWWRATHLKWTEVMAAVAKQKTIHGVGRIYGEDGSEWAVAVWVRVDGPSSFASNKMLLPVKARRNQKPGPEVITLASAANYPGYLALASEYGSSSIARVLATTWGGKPSLVTDASLLPPPHPDLLLFYLDPDTKLVNAAELSSGKRAHATIEYSYSKPLPEGFRPE